MASAGGSSSSKKNKKKRHSAPVVSSPNTISYGPPPTQTVTNPAMPVQLPGYPVQPGLYAPEGYPLQTPSGYPAPFPAGGVPRMAVPTQPMMPLPQRPQQQPQLQPQPQPQQPPPQRQLDFSQAMADFKGMFPNMDLAVIETVLRSNSGKVDETIDQLLKLNADIPETAPAPPPPPVMQPSTGFPVPPSQLPPEMLGNFLDEPPPYSPPEADSPFSRFNSNTPPQSNTPTTPAPPVPVARSRDPTTVQRTPPQGPPLGGRRAWGERRASAVPQGRTTGTSCSEWGTYRPREWNPPMVGNLPTDFLRLSVSGGGDSPSSTPSPSTETSQLGMAPGIKQKLDENTNRRRSLGQNNAESHRMLEDEKLALMMQNEEFLRQLQQDPEFLSALERDYHDALREGRTTSNTAPTTAATPTPSPISPPPRPSLAPVHRQPPPDMANRPLPATPGPELPARPSRMKRESSGSSLPSSSAGGSRGMTNGATSASGGLSVEDIDFRNKLNHMGKSSKTKLFQQAGRFQKKKKASKKYETEGGASDALLGGESLYEELKDNDLAHEVKKRSSKKRHSFGRQRSLLTYEECDPNFFSR
ncbi:LOW QUALITY PROTEIN: proline-rich protein 36-like [Strongylocentrotus purpuratus]|uniref:CUE domain-containing protein n=1 Tax=Strongylocentrotus purpuratus TaxID=7668 RepID=A0A7M7N537_STRPU|nr:LOW QUALITY PROTEIN: proline-rich protein 36-like [Strongylocentrotus purpuratus]